jgi:hypothetical protein
MMTGQPGIPPVDSGVETASPAEIPPQVSARRSRIALWLPITLALVTIVGCELAVRYAGAGINLTVLGLGAALAIFIPLLGLIDQARGWRLQVDSQRLQLTRKTWTGARTVDLTCLTSIRRVRLRHASAVSAVSASGRARSVRVPLDYLILTDRNGSRLTVRGKALTTFGTKLMVGETRATRLVREALGRPGAYPDGSVRISRFAAILLGRSPDSLPFRTGRALLLYLVFAGYAWCVGWVLVVGIPGPAR